MPGPRIREGEQVTLRTAERDDAPFLQRAFADPEIRVPMGNPPPKNRAEVEALVEEGFESDGTVHMLVCLDADDAGPGHPDADESTPIGTVVVSEFDWRRADLAYWLAPEYHGEGYGADAVSLLVDFTFRNFDVPAVAAGVYDFNEASQGLLESLGFTREGRLRKRRFVDGEHVDTLMYGLLREEWAAEDEDPPA